MNIPQPKFNLNDIVYKITSMRREKPCDLCDSTGFYLVKTRNIECRDCEGSGIIIFGPEFYEPSKYQVKEIEIRIKQQNKSGVFYSLYDFRHEYLALNIEENLILNLEDCIQACNTYNAQMDNPNAT